MTQSSSILACACQSAARLLGSGLIKAGKVSLSVECPILASVPGCCARGGSNNQVLFLCKGICIKLRSYTGLRPRLPGLGLEVHVSAEPVLAVLGRLLCLDSRALAAMLKELARVGCADRAHELFDWLRALPPGHDLAPLCDVFTFTTGQRAYSHSQILLM